MRNVSENEQVIDTGASNAAPIGPIGAVIGSGIGLGTTRGIHADG